MNKKYLLGLLFSLCISGKANAVIIEGTFGGLITEITDRSHFDADYTPFWNDVKLGDSLHGTYWYDTALAPTPVESFTKQMQYRNYGPNIPVWSGMTVKLDGHVFDITQDQPDSEWWTLYQADRGLLLGNEMNYGFTVADHFSMINSIIWATGGFQFSSTTLVFGIGGEGVELFNSSELGQEFSWFSEDHFSPYKGGAISKEGYDENGHYDGEVRFIPTYVTARIKPATSVDEPGLALLMLIGMSGVAFCRFMKSSK